MDNAPAVLGEIGGFLNGHLAHGGPHGIPVCAADGVGGDLFPLKGEILHLHAGGVDLHLHSGTLVVRHAHKEDIHRQRLPIEHSRTEESVSRVVDVQVEPPHRLAHEVHGLERYQLIVHADVVAKQSHVRKFGKVSHRAARFVILDEHLRRTLKDRLGTQYVECGTRQHEDDGNQEPVPTAQAHEQPIFQHYFLMIILS